MTKENEIINNMEVKLNEAIDGIRDMSQRVDGNIATKAEKEELAKYEQKFNTMQDAMERLKAAVNAPDFRSKNAGEEVTKHSLAFSSYMKKGNAEGLRQLLEEKALSVGSDEDGGYTVPEDTLKVINTRIYETSPIRQYATVVSISTDSYQAALDNSEAAAEWVSEAQTRDATSAPTFGQKIIPTHELSAKPEASQKLLDDSAVNIESWLAGKVSDKFMRAENASFLTGNGISQPTGLLNSVTAAKALADAPAYNASKIEAYKSGANGSFTADNLLELIHKLKSGYKDSSVIFGGLSARLAMIKLKQDNKYLFEFAGGTLMADGLEFVTMNDMPDVATDALALGVGDLRAAYTIVDRVGIRTLRDPFSRKPFVQFYTTKRVGGDVVNYEAVKLLKLSA